MSARRGCRPAHPVCEQDIVESVLEGCQSSEPVKAVGARGSKNGSFRTSGRAVHLDRYNKILEVHDGAVTAQAGVTVSELNAVLRRHGLALTTNGEWAGASLAGSAATGTHGGSLSHGIFSTSLLSIRIIPADGHAREFHRGSPGFEHAAVSLGALGIISTLTLECEDASFLAMEMEVQPFERYLAAQDDLIRRNEFFSAVWSPPSHRVVTFQANRIPAQAKVGQRRERFCLRHCVHHLLSRLRSFETFPARWSGLTSVDTTDEILSPISGTGTRGRLLRFLGKFVRAAEFAVPLHRASESLAALDELFRLHPGVLALPVGLRATGPDGFSLSPAFGRDSFWIDLFLFPDRRFESALSETFEGLEARCHWGKHLALSGSHLRHQYPRWEAFWEMRDQMDPGRVFANDFTRSLAS